MCERERWRALPLIRRRSEPSEDEERVFAVCG